jgi:hypothetical protein
MPEAKGNNPTTPLLAAARIVNHPAAIDHNHQCLPVARKEVKDAPIANIEKKLTPISSMLLDHAQVTTGAVK